MTRYWDRIFPILIFVLFSLPVFSQDSLFTNPDVYPLQDYMVFSRLGKSMEEVRAISEFGVMREDEPRDVQWIEEIPLEEPIPGALAPVRYLSLKYNLTPGKSNGFWLLLRKKGLDDSWFDWNGFQESTLVLRLGMGETCTSRFRIEMKYFDSKANAVQSATTTVDLTQEALEDISAKGSTDFEIPLKTLVSGKDLSSMRELVLFFDGDEVTEMEGELKLFHIRLVAPPPAKLDVNPLLDDLNQRAFSWFVVNQHPVTGLIRDRWPNSVGFAPGNDICSIASIGFYLSSLPDAIESGLIDHEQARQAAIKVMRFMRDQVETYYGIFPHFLDLSTGKHAWQCEFSLLDSALFLNGCIVVSVYFGGETADLFNEIFTRIEWNRFVVNANGRTLLSMGWRKEQQKFEGPMDVRSSEFSMPIFLAIGSGQVDKEVWYNMEIKQSEIEGFPVLNPTHGLFTSYYSLCWWDLENKKDRDNVDLFQNARNAALANRALTRNSSALTYATQHGGFWGTSAGDYGFNYIAPSIQDVDSIRAVWPMASLAAMPFLPVVIKSDLSQWQSSDIWPYINGPYGLAPFSTDKNWVGHDIIGIDIGSFNLNYINSKNRGVWKWYMQHPIVRKTMEIIYTTDTSRWPDL